MTQSAEIQGKVPDKLAVVTGTSSGLGKAIAQRLIASGYLVAGVSRRESNSELIGPRYCHFVADLSDLASIPVLCKRIMEEAGIPYALINNAAAPLDGLLPMLSDTSISETNSLDLVSPVLVTKHLVKPMISAGVGRIVNVSSIVASTGFRGLSVYGAAKSGLIGFTRSLARDVGRRGVTVNAVAPGFIDTEMTGSMENQMLDRVRARSPLRRFASVAEVAATIDYLLSVEAAGVTGSVLTVDAGSTA